ncbi:MAG: hypothetical protein NW220_03505 [Leptolyngbyaceae cyanobacterium bins.349]|nr:hypothetical protein [Leptolyngbyaceae cyanobacterium bins.349]
MMPLFPLAPRYRLDDELPWLEGIDPSRHYWLMINGDASLAVAIPGLVVASTEEFRAEVLRFRALQPGEHLEIRRAASTCTLICISQNCYAIEADVAGAPVWHLFDQETLESLLRTSHPDWQCAPSDVELGRRLLVRSWETAIAA